MRNPIVSRATAALVIQTVFLNVPRQPMTDMRPEDIRAAENRAARCEILNMCAKENRLPNAEERKRLDALAPRPGM